MKYWHMSKALVKAKSGGFFLKTNIGNVLGENGRCTETIPVLLFVSLIN